MNERTIAREQAQHNFGLFLRAEYARAMTELREKYPRTTPFSPIEDPAELNEWQYPMILQSAIAESDRREVDSRKRLRNG